MDGWTPRKLVLASLGVAVFASALTAGLTAWLLQGRKTPEPVVFTPGAQVTPPTEKVPANPVLAGNFFYDRGRWNEAIAAYEQALAAGPDSPDVRTDLGNCHRFLNQPAAALAQYEIAQKLNPAHEQSLFNQASLYAELLKNPAKASEVAREFIRRFPTSESVGVARKYIADL